MPSFLSKLATTLGLPRSKRLFDGDDAMFKRTVRKDLVYAEYGCGASTIWVARHVGCRILSVDTAKAWVETVKKECAGVDGLSIHHCDLGPVGKWGRPVSYEKAAAFPEYTDWLWSQDVQPDVVLVDGRFRVCCFLTSLLRAREGTRILFDDYTDRPHYQVVEQYLPRSETDGRQALFVVPARERLDLDGIRQAIERFRYVMD